METSEEDEDFDMQGNMEISEEDENFYYDEDFYDVVWDWMVADYWRRDFSKISLLHFSICTIGLKDSGKNADLDFSLLLLLCTYVFLRFLDVIRDLVIASYVETGWVICASESLGESGSKVWWFWFMLHPFSFFFLLFMLSCYKSYCD